MLEVMRLCGVCLQTKPIDQFVKRARSDGSTGYRNCRRCHAEYHRDWRKKNLEHIRKYMLEYKRKNRDKVAESQRRYAERHPNKVKAHQAVGNALYLGTLVRQPCEVCDETKAQAHHDSYEEKNWLKVRWLCVQCHADVHREMNDAETI